MCRNNLIATCSLYACDFTREISVEIEFRKVGRENFIIYKWKFEEKRTPRDELHNVRTFFKHNESDVIELKFSETFYCKTRRSRDVCH